MTTVRRVVCGWLALSVAAVVTACASRPPPVAGGASAGGGRSGGYYQNDGPPDAPELDVEAVPDAVPRREAYSKTGNPESYEALGKTYYVLRSAKGFTQTGRASWYGRQFHGNRTSSGEPYNMYEMTAAHKRLPIPSYVRVTNLDNDKQVVVRVNDRGPFHDGRIIDLSYVAARKLGIVAAGSAPVRIRTVTPQARHAGGNVREPHRASPPSTPATSKASRQSRPARAVRVADRGPQSSGGKLYLQSGAFGKAANARALSARLHASGFDKVVIVDPDRTTPLYRVRIGPFGNQGHREHAHNNLVAHGFAAREIDP